MIVGLPGSSKSAKAQSMVDAPLRQRPAILVNEPNACRANLVLRNASEAVIRSIDTLKWEYEIPEGVEALPVWRPAQS
ncbi:hypothetical protein A0U91_16125 (plasmid) [Acetobacter persici]|uniref:Uncharacterized protein n=1 Tax=Acetobacter persici TaxID=1076596 RepID=A0A1U9LJ95_9PROT|nr:hypothetical protein A0U91_16125 [Acetobacter persici]